MPHEPTTTRTCETDGHIWVPSGKCVMCGERRLVPHARLEPEYTREEMRETCRNNYNAAMQRAAEAARDIGRAISKGSLRSAGPSDTGEMIATAILELQYAMEKDDAR